MPRQQQQTNSILCPSILRVSRDSFYLPKCEVRLPATTFDLRGMFTIHCGVWVWVPTTIECCAVSRQVFKMFSANDIIMKVQFPGPN